MERIGARGFGEVGSVEYLMEHFGLTAEAIYQKAKVLIARKKDKEVQNDTGKPEKFRKKGTTRTNYVDAVE
jgi:hypothetical protein